MGYIPQAHCRKAGIWRKSTEPPKTRKMATRSQPRQVQSAHLDARKRSKIANFYSTLISNRNRRNSVKTNDRPQFYSTTLRRVVLVEQPLLAVCISRSRPEAFPTQICGGPVLFRRVVSPLTRKSHRLNNDRWQKCDSARQSMSHCFGCNPMKTNARVNF